ncbi:MAG: HAMP domain-containing sensor histidine kinase [Parcubacteria group bacterium]|jgi:signal transduction histidine kinase
MEIINDLNLKKQAEELGLKVWQTPSFLFMMMGLVTLIAMTATYYISKNYDDPAILLIAECVVVVTIFSIGNSVIREIEQMAKINKMKTEFVFVASHQLRTPLSAILWEVELLLSKRKEGLNEKQMASLESISALSGRMARLVSDLLDVARIDQGKLMLKKERVDLNLIVQEVIKILDPLIKAKSLRIVFNGGKSAQVTGDPEKLRLVLENLISNAVKYTLSHGKIEIKADTQRGFVVCSVRDNGVGIPQNQQKLVFDKFFRSDNVVKYQTEGTGLGLYIAKNIIEQSAGKIWFESKEDVGTVFSFSLPACSPYASERPNLKG